MSAPEPSPRPFLGWPVTIVAGLAVVAFAVWNVKRELNLSRDRGAKRESCLVNLREMESRKSAWFAATGVGTNAQPTLEQVYSSTGALARAALPACPIGGTYTPGKTAEKPRCNAPGHSLETLRW
jgi:hypothetical protein